MGDMFSKTYRKGRCRTEQKLEYSLRVRLKKNSNFFGPGVEELLLLVDRTGSLQTAAATMEMSYSKAWKIVRAAEQELGFAILERHVGGMGGGSSALTEGGRNFVARYSGFRQALSAAAENLFRRHFEDERDGETDEKA